MVLWNYGDFDDDRFVSLYASRHAFNVALILVNQIDEKMIPIGHIYDLPTMEADDEEVGSLLYRSQIFHVFFQSPFEGLTSEEQYQLLLGAFKNCCLVCFYFFMVIL